MNKDYIYNRIRKLRLQRKWSIEELSERAGMKSTIYQLLSDCTIYPPLDVVLAYCEAFELTLTELLAEENEIVLIFPDCDRDLCCKYKRSFSEKQAKIANALRSVLRCML